MKRTAATECGTGEVPRIEPTQEAHAPDEVGHLGVDHRRDAGGRLVPAHAKAGRDAIHSLLGQAAV